MFLNGLKVLDVGSYVAAPAAATVMSDFGADVIKVEPLDGDPYRRLLGGVLQEYPNFFWDQDARNKRSLAIDITNPAGSEVIERLIRGCDVFVTNYRAALLERLRLTYEHVSALKEDVIYGQVNAYGLKGPEANRTGFDATAWWAGSGLMDFVRRPQGAHAVSAPGMGDHPTCMALLSGIMAALYRREKTGQGAHVHTSLLANGAWAHCMMIQGALVGYDVTGQRTPEDLKATPFATMYDTSDGRLLLLCVLNPLKEWPRLLRAIGHTEWASDPRFAGPEQWLENRVALFDLLAEAFRSDTAAGWRRRLDAEEVTYAVANTLAEVINDEQLFANDVLTEVAPGRHLHAHTVNSPVWITGEQKRVPAGAPDIGEHSVDILGEAGFSSAEIDGLLSGRVVRQAPGGDGPD